MMGHPEYMAEYIAGWKAELRRRQRAALLKKLEQVAWAALAAGLLVIGWVQW